MERRRLLNQFHFKGKISGSALDFYFNSNENNLNQINLKINDDGTFDYVYNHQLSSLYSPLELSADSPNKNITALTISELDTKDVTSMYGVFADYNNLITLEIPTFDFSNVRDMTGLFFKCHALESIDTSHWNVSKNESLFGTFRDCSGLTTLDVSNWDTSKVTNIQGLFLGCSSLETLDVAHFRTPKVTNMSNTFARMPMLVMVQMENWVTESVETLEALFYNDVSLETYMNLPLKEITEGMRLERCENMNSMFYNCQNCIQSGKFFTYYEPSTRRLTDTAYMFYRNYSMTKFEGENLITPALLDCHWMFGECSGLTEVDLTNIDFNNVKTYNNIFIDCENLIKITTNANAATWMIEHADEINLPYQFKNNQYEGWKIVSRTIDNNGDAI